MVGYCYEITGTMDWSFDHMVYLELSLRFGPFDDQAC